jgi:voltage-gated sodium channel
MARHPSLKYLATMAHKQHTSTWSFANIRERINNHELNPLDNVVILLILLSAVVVGLETNHDLVASNPTLFHAIDLFFIVAFGSEIVIKMSMLNPKPWRYFLDGWHIFDSVVFALTLVPYIVSSDPHAAEAAIALRSLRLVRSFRALRVMRLVGELPGMRIVIETLVRSIPQLSIVAALMGCLTYTYAVIGYNLFHANDPRHFGNLGSSCLTMFGCALGEFNDVMRIQIDGSSADEGYHEMLIAKFGASAVHAEPFPVLAPLFFLTFVLIAGLTILNFFVGTILTELDNVRSEIRAEELAAATSKIDMLVEEETEQTAELAEILAELREIKERLPKIKS